MARTCFDSTTSSSTRLETAANPHTKLVNTWIRANRRDRLKYAVRGVESKFRAIGWSISARDELKLSSMHFAGHARLKIKVKLAMLRDCREGCIDAIAV